MTNISGRGDTLLDSMAEECVMLTRAVVSDGLGGFTNSWVDGVTFSAMIRKDSTTQDKIAERQGVKEGYTVVVQKGFPIVKYDVFRRKLDGKTYRVTSNIQDSEAPAASTVKIGAVTAERWDLPNA